MFFDLQRFDDVAYGPKWIYRISPIAQDATKYFIPAGKTYVTRAETSNVYEPPVTLFQPDPCGNQTITVYGISAPTPNTSTTITASLFYHYASGGAQAISDVTVTGSDAPLLRITIDGVEYMADETGHLVPVPTAVDISGNAWYALYSEQTTFGWLNANSTTMNDGYLDDGDSNVTVWITNVSAVSGTAAAATATLASDKTISDVTVTGGAAETIHITIGGVEYAVDGCGKLCNLSSFNFMTREDKQKLDGINSSTYLTTAAAASTYLGKTAKAASASTADALTTRRVLYISDKAGANTGPGVFFSGTANATIKMPDTAVFTKLTTTNLVLGTTASTTEGAMWLEWS